MSIFLGSQLEDVIAQLEQGAGVRVQAGRPRGAGRDLAAGPAEGRHGPQPDLAVRLHRQQVRVPRGRLVRPDLLAADRAQHRGRGLARRPRRRAGEAGAGRLRGPDRHPLRASSGSTSRSCSRATATPRSGTPRPPAAGCPTTGRPSTRCRRSRPTRRRRSSRASACCPSASSSPAPRSSGSGTSRSRTSRRNCSLDIARTMILPAAVALPRPAGGRGLLEGHRRRRGHRRRAGRRPRRRDPRPGARAARGPRGRLRRRRRPARSSTR